MPMRLITLFVPDYLLKRIDDLVKEKKYPNRSETIRLAIKDLLEKEGKI